MRQQEATASQAVTKQIDQNMLPATGSTTQGTSDVMIVDPKVISQDWLNAFQALQRKKATNIVFGLRDNSMIADVTDIEVLSGGYLILFSVRTLQGPKYQIVRTSDITALSSQ